MLYFYFIIRLLYDNIFYFCIKFLLVNNSFFDIFIENYFIFGIEYEKYFVFLEMEIMKIKSIVIFKIRKGKKEVIVFFIFM